MMFFAGEVSDADFSWRWYSHLHVACKSKGGQSNSHPGNMQWRTLVAANKELYVSLPKKQKMLLSQSIVNAVRSQDPPGRFLGKDNKTETWHDVGDKRAQEKTSQALREGAPEIRKNLKGKGNKADKKSAALKTDGLERTTSREEMPPPSITIPAPPPSFQQEQVTSSPSTQPKASMQPPPKPPQPKSTAPPKQPVPTMSNPTLHSAYQDGGYKKSADETMPPPPTQIQEGDLSFGSMALMSDTEQARLMHAYSIGSAMSHQNILDSQAAKIPETQAIEFPPQDVQPVDGGLENIGVSFGSMMSIGTMPGNGNLERGGLSIGSVMSYSVNNEMNGGKPYLGAPDLQDIGTSFGSLTLAPGERERIIREAENEMETAAACAPPATFLEQQRSRGNLLECEDSDDEDSAQASVNNSAGWERLQAALAAQKTSNSIAPPPMPGGAYNDPPSSFQYPSNMGRGGYSSNMTSMGSQYTSQQSHFPLVASQALERNDDPIPFNASMPPPLPVMKQSDNWPGDEPRSGN